VTVLARPIGRIAWGVEGGSAGTAIVVAGLALLASRPFLRLPPTASVGFLVAVYGGILASSLAVPAPSGPSRLAPVACLALGLAAVVFSARIAGPAAPIAWSGAALPVGVLAAFAEEALLRRVAYGRLARFGALAAVAGTAALFAMVHLPAYGSAAFPVDLGAGLLLSWQRWAAGTWAVPAATHAFANVLVIVG
jgi:membrane protease YdiL (CAAX protease family)